MLRCLRRDNLEQEVRPPQLAAFFLSGQNLRCRLMTRMGSPDRLSCCPVIGIDRKRLAERPIDAIDPERTSD